jgi:acyl dehydratase
VDAARSSKRPFGATIAHGFLTLSLVSYFPPRPILVEGTKLVLNYGCDRVRFPAALRTGSRARARAEIVSLEDVGGDAGQVKVRVSVELTAATSQCAWLTRPAALTSERARAAPRR